MTNDPCQERTSGTCLKCRLPSFHISFCGTACLGKSYLLSALEQEAEIGVVYSDYKENTDRIPLFKLKHESLSIQAVYTANMMRMYYGNECTNPIVCHDRNMFSDIFYDCVNLELHETGKGVRKLEEVYSRGRDDGGDEEKCSLCRGFDIRSPGKEEEEEDEEEEEKREAGIL